MTGSSSSSALILPAEQAVHQPQADPAHPAGNGGFQKQSRGHIRCPEKDPRKVDKEEGHGPPDPAGQSVPPFSPQAFQNLRQPVKQAP